MAMATRNTLVVLTGAFTLLGAAIFLAHTPSPVSAQSSAQPATVSHSLAPAASKPRR